jgi:hypothetical protein
MKSYYNNIGVPSTPHRYYLDDIIYNPTKDIQQLVENYPTIYRSDTIKIQITKFDVCANFLVTIIDYRSIIGSHEIFTIKSTIVNGLIDISDKRIKKYKHYIFRNRGQAYTYSYENGIKLVNKAIKLIFRSNKQIKYSFPTN